MASYQLDFTTLDRVKRTPVQALEPQEMMWLGDASVRFDYLKSLKKAFGPRSKQVQQAKWVSDFFRYAGAVDSDFEDYQYIASIIGPKKDPWGRLPLYHCMASMEAVPTYNIGIAWAGTRDEAQLNPRPDEGIMVGRGYSWYREVGRSTIEKEPGNERYTRTHIPMEVSQPGAGIGFAFYSTHALTARFMYGLTGSHSAEELGREPPAQEWWEKAVRRGYAKQKTLYVPGYADNGVLADVLDADDVLRSDLIMLLMQPANSPAAKLRVPVGCNLMPAFTQTAASTYSPPSRLSQNFLNAEQLFDQGEKSWRPEDGKPRANLIRAGVEAGIYNKQGLPVYARSHDSAKRADLLSNVWHGPSPVLTALVLEMIAQASPSKAVAYATRVDVAYIIKKNPNLLRVIEKVKKRMPVAGMPGLSGLSAYEAGEIVAAAASMPPAKLSGNNPLRLPSMGAAASATLARFEGL